RSTLAIAEGDDELALELATRAINSPSPRAAVLAKWYVGSLLLSTKGVSNDAAMRLLYEVRQQGYRWFTSAASLTLGEALLDRGQANEAKELLLEATGSNDSTTAIAAAVALGWAFADDGAWAQAYAVVADTLRRFEIQVHQDLLTGTPDRNRYGMLAGAASEAADELDPTKRAPYGEYTAVQALIGLAGMVAIDVVGSEGEESPGLPPSDTT
ncbi:MAG: hypothetical protein LC808_40900, partial [Actinobacteria bacterium]|nr:hypothetical protein [Actinomycetota bacterium]